MSNNNHIDKADNCMAHVQTDLRFTLTLKDVWHIQGLYIILLSTHSLDLDGYHNVISH